ncbi:MAG: hypothetical protein V3V67_03215 [Myxococcota bacterium]
MSDPEFLTLDEVLSIHADQIRCYGGAGGVRDVSLLMSAIGMAGNKRTALRCALVFLRENSRAR